MGITPKICMLCFVLINSVLLAFGSCFRMLAVILQIVLGLVGLVVFLGGEDLEIQLYCLCVEKFAFWSWKVYAIGLKGGVWGLGGGGIKLEVLKSQCVQGLYISSEFAGHCCYICWHGIFHRLFQNGNAGLRWSFHLSCSVSCELHQTSFRQENWGEHLSVHEVMLRHWRYCYIHLSSH